MPLRPSKPASGPTRQGLRRIVLAMERAYGSPRHGNPRNPLDDLIYIILSTRTRDASFAKTFRSLKRAFPSWNSVSPRHRPKIARILAPGGLGRLKASQIVSIMARLRSRFGRSTLAPLSKMSDAEAEGFLTSLPGVGPKIAKCVLMYTLDRQVLPVDVHVHRVAVRLGLGAKRRPDTSQQLIESAVPPELRYSFHVNAISHGRSVCFSRAPLCGECPICRWCEYYLCRKELKRN